jgi:hypothetical protein
LAKKSIIFFPYKVEKINENKAAIAALNDKN